MIRRWIKLPESFTQIVIDSRPSGLWLRSERCPHGPVWVAARFSSHCTMFFEKGWKTFLRSRNISRGDTIVFKFNDEDNLWARIFDSGGDRSYCCMESSSS